MPQQSRYSLTISETLDDEYYHLLQHKLRAYNRQVAIRMEPPEAVPLNIRVEDGAGNLMGGVAAVTYWRWLVIKLFVLADELRDADLGRRLLWRVHEEAIARGCLHAQTTTYDFQALNFYLKHGYFVVGELTDYPHGYNYYWLRKDLTQGERASSYES